MVIKNFPEIFDDFSSFFAAKDFISIFVAVCANILVFQYQGALLNNITNLAKPRRK